MKERRRLHTSNDTPQKEDAALSHQLAVFLAPDDIYVAIFRHHIVLPVFSGLPTFSGPRTPSVSRGSVPQGPIATAPTEAARAQTVEQFVHGHCTQSSPV